jgi:hypothetical protein
MGYGGGEQEVAAVVAMANPYNKPEKRKRDDGRQPLHPKSPNEPAARSKSNPSAKFARRDKDNTGAT